MNDNKHIDDFFKEELGNYSETPPPAAWEALQKKLVQPKAPGLSYRWYSYFAVLASAVVVIVMLAKFMQNAPVTTTPQIAAAAQTAKPVAVPATEQTTNAHTSTKGAVEATAPDAASVAIANPHAGSTSASPTKPAITANTAQTPAPAKNQTHSEAKQGMKTVVVISAKAKRTVMPAQSKTRKTSAPVINTAQGTQTAAGSPIASVLPISAYSSGPSDPGNTTVSSQAALTDQPAVAAAPDTPEAPATAAKKAENRNETIKKKAASVLDKPAPPKAKRNYQRLEAGIKAGYERGLDNTAARKIVASPYLQFNVSRKFSFMIQPALKMASIDTRRIGSVHAYYQVNNDGSVTQKGNTTPVYDGISTNPIGYITKYTYTQTHDSIVKSYTYGSSYTEFEVPLLVKYAFTKGFALYGGVNMTYSKLTSIKENTYTKHNIAITKDSASFSQTITGATPPAITDVITYKGNPISEYGGPLYVTTNQTQLNLGYMIGFTCQFGNRWLFDGLMQQTPAKSNMVGGFNLNTNISAPYFRVSVGYKITK